MGKIVSFICDECGKQRENDTNRWWQGYYVTKDNFETELRVRKFDRNDGTATLWCGEECAMKAFSRWLATGTLEGQKGEK